MYKYGIVAAIVVAGGMAASTLWAQEPAAGQTGTAALEQALANLGKEISGVEAQKAERLKIIQAQGAIAELKKAADDAGAAFQTFMKGEKVVQNGGGPELRHARVLAHGGVVAQRPVRAGIRRDRRRVQAGHALGLQELRRGL